MFWIAVLVGLVGGALTGVLTAQRSKSKLLGSGVFVASSIGIWLLVWFASLFGFPEIQLTLAGALGAAAVIAITSRLSGASLARSGVAAAVAFAVTFIINWWFLALDMPEFTGTLGGYNWFICTNLFWAGVVGLVSSLIFQATREDSDDRDDRYSDRRSRRDDREIDWKKQRRAQRWAAIRGFIMAFLPVIGPATAFVLFVSWGIGNDIAYHVGADNKVYYAGFLNVREAGPNDKLPVSDVHNMRKVPDDVACSRAQNALNPDASIASLFKVDCGELVALEIDNHLWAVAPLEYQNNWSQRGWPGTTYRPNSPGYVRVDLQADNGVGELMVGEDHELNFFPSAMLEKNLYRHIYQAGYTNGVIDDITLEPADKDQNHKPYFTATFITYEVGVDGERIKKVLLIDAKTGKITDYELGHTPEWVDLVVSSRLRTRWANDYLAFGWNPNALNGYTWWAGGHGNQYKILDSRLMMDASRHHPTALMTITSNDNTNTTPLGVMACATEKNDCVIWSKLRMQQADHAEASCKSLMGSKNSKVVGRVDRMQPYVILDRLTWMAPIAQNSGTGIAGYCLVDATMGNASAQNGAVEQDLRSAVYEYGRRLDAEADANDPDHAAASKNKVTLTGVIFKIGPLTFNSEIRYEIVISKDGKVVPMVFIANPQNVPAALLDKGEPVTITYNAVEHTAQPDILSIDAPSLKDIPPGLLRLGTDDQTAPAAPK